MSGFSLCGSGRLNHSSRVFAGSVDWEYLGDGARCGNVDDWWCLSNEQF